MKRIRERLISTIFSPTLGLNFVWAFLFFVVCCLLLVVSLKFNCQLPTANYFLATGHWLLFIAACYLHPSWYNDTRKALSGNG